MGLDSDFSISWRMKRKWVVVQGGSAVWNRNQITILNVPIEEQMLILRNIFNTIYCQVGTKNVFELWYLQGIFILIMYFSLFKFKTFCADLIHLKHYSQKR